MTQENKTFLKLIYVFLNLTRKEIRIIYDANAGMRCFNLAAKEIDQVNQNEIKETKKHIKI